MPSTIIEFGFHFKRLRRLFLANYNQRASLLCEQRMRALFAQYDCTLALFAQYMYCVPLTSQQNIESAGVKYICLYVQYMYV